MRRRMDIEELKNKVRNNGQSFTQDEAYEIVHYLPSGYNHSEYEDCSECKYFDYSTNQYICKGIKKAFNFDYTVYLQDNHGGCNLFVNKEVITNRVNNDTYNKTSVNQNYENELLQWLNDYHAPMGGYILNDENFKIFSSEIIRDYHNHDKVICNPEKARKYIKEVLSAPKYFYGRASTKSAIALDVHDSLMGKGDKKELGTFSYIAISILTAIVGVIFAVFGIHSLIMVIFTIMIPSALEFQTILEWLLTIFLGFVLYKLYRKTH
jgi:hypothetical protein